MTTSEQINELAEALAMAQATMGGALKESANPFFKSKYADLASVRAACLPALTKCGLAVLQSPSTNGAIVTVETLLVHRSGQWVKGEVTCTAKDEGPQAVGSAITYLRRYALQSFAGVAAEDDDAEAAQGRGNGKDRAISGPTPVDKGVEPPKGFDDWWTDLATVAEEGTTRLQAAWKTAKPDYRQYVVAAYGKRWEALKRYAANVSDPVSA